MVVLPFHFGTSRCRWEGEESIPLPYIYPPYGRYDTRQAYAVAAARETKLVVPPRENAVPWEKGHPRNAVLEQVVQRGMAEWKKESGYHRRSIAENAMYRLKQLFGDSLASRLIETQVTEVHTRIAALNAMTYLGMPVSVRVGTILS